MPLIEISGGLSKQQYETLVKLISIQGRLFMASVEELKTAVEAAVAGVKADIAAAITKETAEISIQIADLKAQIASGVSVSPADLDSILDSVKSIGTAGVAGVDTISTEDGADKAPVA